MIVIPLSKLQGKNLLPSKELYKDAIHMSVDANNLTVYVKGDVLPDNINPVPDPVKDVGVEVKPE